MKIQVSIAEELLKASKGLLALAVVVAKVKVDNINDELWQMLQDMGNTQKDSYESTKMNLINPINALNVTYKALGVKAENKGSNEALLKRVVTDKGLYQINNVVDANNFISIASLHSVGSYDLAKLTGNIVFRPGLDTEAYPATKKRSLKLHRLPVLCDNDGHNPFGGPTSDSERALISTETIDLMTVIFCFDGDSCLENHMQQMAALLTQYCYSDPATIQCKIVRKMEEFDITIEGPEAISSEGLNRESSSNRPFFALSSEQPTAILGATATAPSPTN